MKIFPSKFVISLIIFSLIISCNKNESEENSEMPIFELLNSDITGIDFQNNLTEGPNTNILLYEYFYNGGGVATGDFNQDGLLDLYFTANMSENKLYINKGNLKFEDHSSASGASGRPGPWKTGVSVVDINADGKLDIYLCYSGTMPEEKRANELFINQGNDANGMPIFKESAEEYGIGQKGYSNQAYFFDADNDGDLDMLLLNHNPKNLPLLNAEGTSLLLKIDNPEKGVRFFKQENGKFKDFTTASGINGSELSYGLAIGISDLNNDGWPDFYVSNDYTVPDYFYINNKNGTFSNQLQNSLTQTSQFSMGNDIADYNNDGLADIFTLDMLPEDNLRQKLLISADNFAKFNQNVSVGFYYQYMRNMLHRNLGNGTFSEIAQWAGVSNTDWSWSALMADYDNDGWKDLMVTNGYFRDLTNMDFLMYKENYIAQKGKLQKEDILEIIKNMPASNVSNYLFANKKDGQFVNKSKNWGLERPSNSNGALYADLDNDGDLDLVVNNINQPAFVYQNNTNKTLKNQFVQVKLEGSKGNTMGLGAKITLFSGKNIQFQELYNCRGYLSSVSPLIHFGLGDIKSLDSIRVIWPSGKYETKVQLNSNQIITFKQEDAFMNFNYKIKNESLFKEAVKAIAYESQKVNYNDFERQLLLTNQLSYEGPCMTKADINADGLEDLLLGGDEGFSTQIFIQNKNGSFTKKDIGAFESDAGHVDAGITVFDANSDGIFDIYIASGGYHNLKENDAKLNDRLYLGDANGNFTKSGTSLPATNLSSKSKVLAIDINSDGHQDLIVGGKMVPGQYPKIPKSYILINNGKGNFMDQTSKYLKESLGMVRDMALADLNGDKIKELVVVGEYEPIRVFKIEKDKLVNISEDFFEDENSGWWNTIAVGDFDNDQIDDIIVGNMGLNTQFKVSKKFPITLNAKDFDGNGIIDPILSFSINEKRYPNVTRDELLIQAPYFRPRFTNFQSYAELEFDKIFESSDLADSQFLEAQTMETTLFLGNKNGKMKELDLPKEVQWSPVYAIQVLDYNGDGNQDLILAGNNSKSKIRLGRFDGNFGLLLEGNGKGRFEYQSQKSSGLNVWGDVRSIISINKQIIFGINGGKLKVYEFE